MKKWIFITLLAVAALAASAQTNFRELTYKEAVAAAKKEGKLVFMDFYTSWCGPCKMMLRDVFPQKSVGDYLNARFVCIKIDAEKGEGVELRRRYGVTVYPTFVGIDAAEKEVMRVVGGASAGDFIADIERQINADKSPERLRKRYESGERSAELVEAYAALKIAESRAGRRPDDAKRKEAFDIVMAYFNSLNDKQRVATENLFIYLDYTVSPFDEPASYLIANRHKFAFEAADRVNARIAELFRGEVAAYLCGSAAYDADAFRSLKQQAEELQLNSDGYYTAAFRLIDTYGSGDLNAWLAACEKEYSRLPAELQSTLVTNFSRLLASADGAVRARASRFLRNLFLTMDASLIMWTATELGKIEGTIGH